MLRSLIVAALISLLAGCATPPATSPVPPPASIVDGMVDIGGLSLHIHCKGTGTPTVLMEAGARGDGTVWRPVLPELGKVTQVRVYDRAGAGYSDTPPQPRAAARITEELHTLVAAAKLAGPFVLVEHSLGGLYVRLYAARFPADVAGMVLVDAATEDEDVRIWPLVPAAVLAAADHEHGADGEGIDLRTIGVATAQLRSANRSLGDKPLVVLTAGQRSPVPGVSPETDAQMAKISAELQAALPSLSSNGTQVVATKSHHFIQREAPKLVIGAVQQVVGAVRTHGRIDPAPLQALADYYAP